MNSSTSSYDLLVIGSGAAGLAAAVTAAHLGQKVLLLEKETVLGGTTAWSGGWMWIPRNALARQAGIDEHPSAARNYLRLELGDRFDSERIDAFLHQAPRMVDFFRLNTALEFIDGNQIPDFHGRNPYATKGGRSVCAAPFDGRELGATVQYLRAPLDITTLWGMGLAAGADIRHFMQTFRHPHSFLYVSGRLLRHARDFMFYGRSMQLLAGNALVGRLLKSAQEAGVDWLTEAKPVRLRRGDDGQINGVELMDGRAFNAKLGVVLACGGCPHDDSRLEKLLPYGQAAIESEGRPHFSAAPGSNTGDGLKLAEAVGAAVDATTVHAMADAPVSRVPRADGSVAHFPHLIERGKPGLIAVTRQGLRFCNEANSYSDFMRALFKATPSGDIPSAWLLVDHRFLRRYGLGAVKPFPFPIRKWLRNGYLKRGQTLDALASVCAIEPGVLQATVERYNRDAKNALDPQFERGNTPYNRMQGDHPSKANQPWSNPNLAPIGPGPFYAVQVLPGSLGSFAGLRTNAQAQVLDGHGQAIAGLYACGNDMASIMGGHYPSGGITLGPAMTFGYIAAHHAAGRHFPAANTVVQPIETQPMYYELATMTLPFGSAVQAANQVKAFCDAAPAQGELLGCWFSDIGVLNQMMVLRGFSTIDALRAERERTQHHVSPFGCGDLLQSLEQHSYQGFQWMKPVRPSAESGIHGPVYEIRTYGIKPGGVQGTIELWQHYLPGREKLSSCVTAMVALDGPLRFTNIWAYESLNARSQLRAEAVAQGLWPPKGGPALLTTAMTSTIALPTAVSPLK